MKKNILLLFAVAFSFTALPVNAQRCGHHYNNRNCYSNNISISHCQNICNELNLDQATSDKFTAIYNNYLEDIKTLRSDCPADIYACMRNESIDGLTDVEIEKIIKLRFSHSRKMLDLREKYYKEFRKVLSVRQIERMYRCERNNGRAMMNEYNRRQSGRYN